MIVTADIEDIVLMTSKAFGIGTMTNGSPQYDDKTGEGLTKETVVVHAKPQTDGKYWLPSFVEVNLCVPDYKSGKENFNRIKVLERKAREVFKRITGQHDGTFYRIGINSLGIEEDKPLKCHYVNCRLLFEVINTL